MKIFLLLLLALGPMSSCGKNKKESYSLKPEPSERAALEDVVIPEVPKDDFIIFVNEYRVKKGLRPLETSAVIEEVAFGHCRKMALRKRLFGHHGFKKRCAELRERLEAVSCGEIVARGQATPKEAFHAWINSDGHRETIEGKDFTHTGFAKFTSSSGVNYWAQIFVEIK